MPKKSSPAVDLDKSHRIGEQQETITIELDDADVERERALVMDLLGRVDNLKQARASSNADYKAKIARVEKEMNDARKAATTKKRQIDVVVEEWLRGSQVFRIRADTGEVLGQRAATSGERQETMFNDQPKAADRFAAEPFGDVT